MHPLSPLVVLIATAFLAGPVSGVAGITPETVNASDPFMTIAAVDPDGTSMAQGEPMPMIRVWDAEVEAQMAQAVPEIETGIGPGSALRINHSGSTFLCTANFVFTDDFDRLYLGTAGHCVLPEDKTATHGPQADYDAKDTRVEVRTGACPVSGLGAGCGVGGSASPWVPLGDLAFAIYTDIGIDFAIIEIPNELADQVRHELPAWGGPSSEGTLGTGDTVLHYGQGVAYGEAFPTRARAGLGITGGTYWTASGASNPGDSGSGVVTGASGPGALTGEHAIGILTHGIGQAGLGVPGAFFGTHVETAKQLVGEHRGLRVWTLPGGAPLPGLEPPPESGGNVNLEPGTVLLNHQHNESTTTTWQYTWPNDWDHVRILLSTTIESGQVRLEIKAEDNHTLYEARLQDDATDEFVLQNAPTNDWTLRLEYENHTGSLSLRIEEGPSPTNGEDTSSPQEGDTQSEDGPPTKSLPLPGALAVFAILGLAMVLRRMHTQGKSG